MLAGLNTWMIIPMFLKESYRRLTLYFLDRQVTSLWKILPLCMDYYKDNILKVYKKGDLNSEFPCSWKLWIIAKIIQTWLILLQTIKFSITKSGFVLLNVKIFRWKNYRMFHWSGGRISPGSRGELLLSKFREESFNNYRVSNFNCNAG